SVLARFADAITGRRRCPRQVLASLDGGVGVMAVGQPALHGDLGDRGGERFSVAGLGRRPARRCPARPLDHRGPPRRRRRTALRLAAWPESTVAAREGPCRTWPGNFPAACLVETEVRGECAPGSHCQLVSRRLCCGP